MLRRPASAAATASATLATPSSANATSVLRHDSLLSSVAVLLAMTVVQRGVGFVRSVLLCRWLAPEQLGQWDLALGFLELAAPVAVLGIPGSFGRYVQRYLPTGQLTSFLRQTALVSGALSALVATLIFSYAARFSELIFGSAGNSGIVRLLSVGLLALVAHFFVMTLLTGLCQNRAAYRQELTQSLTFTLLALLAVGLAGGEALSLVLAYCAACCVAVGFGVLRLREVGRPALAAREPLSARVLWPTLLPFSLWVWGTNWLSNLFDLADRYMLVHFSGLANAQALELVGNYHSARILPLLLVSVTSSLATMLTPYLSRDWEAGQRQMVAQRLNLFIKVLGWGLTAAAVAIMWLAPWLFQAALKGKYAGGQSVLTWTLTYCAWFGVARVAQKYLWCAERVNLAVLAWGAGLTVNVALNLCLLPRFGLQGVVLSTAAGNLVSLAMIVSFNWFCGMPADRGAVLVLLLPLALHLGAAPAAVVLAVVLLMAYVSPKALSAEERALLTTTWNDVSRKWRPSVREARPV